MATSARSTALRDRDRRTAADSLLDRLREQFPELAVADLAEAVIGAPALPGSETQPVDPYIRPETPRHRA